MFQINEDFIFFCASNQLIAVDTKQQRIFKVNKDIFLRIADWVFDKKLPLSDIGERDQELIKSNALIDKSDKISKWQGDRYSQFFYHLSRNLNQKIPFLNQQDFIEKYISISQQSANKIASLESFYPENITNKISLEVPNLEAISKATLLSALLKRKTSRNFNGEPLTLENINILLYLSFGEVHGKEWDEFNTLNVPQFGIRKTSPSASGLHACGAFLVAFEVLGLEKGIYYYDASEHTLLQVSQEIDHTMLTQLVCDQFWVEGLAAGIFITLDMRRVWVKDPHLRGLPVAYAEAGHFSQTLQLIATSLNINTWLSGTFRDEELVKKLSIDDEFMFASLFVGLGKGANTAIPQAFLTHKNAL